ncbi:hypothetical protein U9M48_035581 [Paspalum notatum var. saurae]|uniref:Reverse transcriptase Ty1/copia-type domain-containing protein n=1 Tax=Paspalum notatum var. saurae TaxID=547442 RepID=A0AAQ3UFD9_PASNO
MKKESNEFSAPYSPQQNGVVERKNRTLIDMARTMLDECFILNKKLKSSKFPPKVDEGFLLGYCSNAHTYRFFNKTTGCVEIARDVTFDETNGSQKEQVDSHVLGDEEPPCEAIKKLTLGEVKPQANQVQDNGENEDGPSSSISVDLTSHKKIKTIKSKAKIKITMIEGHMLIKKMMRMDQFNIKINNHTQECAKQYNGTTPLTTFLGVFKEGLVPNQNLIGTKWVFRNKQDEHGVVTRNKARLVAQGFTQVEGLDFGETYAPVARIESIQILIAFATHHNFKLYQMDVKSAFLNGPIQELVYVEQPSGFEDPKNPHHVYKLHKALYGLKQAPRAWYECLKDFLLKNGFEIGKADSTLFTRKFNDDLFVCQIYVDDIIFGSTNKAFCDQFSRIITKRFEMSMMCELKFFLGFQIKQLKEGTFLCQTKYIQDMLKKFDMKNAKPVKTPMTTKGHLDLYEGDKGKSIDQKLYRSLIRPDIMLSVCMCARFQANPKECHLVAVKRILRYLVHTPNLGLWYPKGSTFDLLGYFDSDHASCKVDRKSTSGTCQFLGRSLVSWSSKKQNSVALSPAEAEYVVVGACCAQLLWMRQTLRDFGCEFSKIPLLCDNESAIKLANNPVHHALTKHIDIRHHFLRDHEAKGDIAIHHVSSENQLADIFTKPLDEKRFCALRSELNILDSRNME